MNAPGMLQPAAPRFMDPALRALLNWEAADQAFDQYVNTGEGNGPQLNSARIAAYAAYLCACRINTECKQ